jgi:non-specific serine/threonine protein kinase
VRQALALRRDLARAGGMPGGAGVSLALLACVASAQGRAARAARLFGAVEHRPWSGPRRILSPEQRDIYDRGVATARAALGEAAFAAAWAAGGAMAPEDAVAYALADDPDAP